MRRNRQKVSETVDNLLNEVYCGKKRLDEMKQEYD